MNVRRVNIDGGDPLKVYELVRSHLRGTARGRGRDPGAATTAAEAAGLGAAAGQRRRRPVGATTPRRGRPPTGGLWFRDFFANDYKERFWRSRGLLVDDLIETMELEDQRGIYSDEAGAPGNAAFYMDTLSERYTDVHVTALFVAYGAPAVIAGARTASDGASILSGYLLSASPTTGVVNLIEVTAGVLTTLATTTLGPLGDQIGLELTCNGDQLTARVNGPVVLGPITHKAHASGSVGFGRLTGGFEWLCHQFGAAAP